jgi:small-conductance mechanosensitive channel
MTRDRLEDAFLRLRAAAHADEYVPMEDVIEVVLARLARAEKENRWEAYAAFGSNYKDVTAEVIALREERDEALRLLATRVEAKRLDEAQEEIARLCAEARRADEEATTLANSDLATTEQVVRALRAENERLRAVEQDLNHLRRVTEGLVQRVADLDVEVAALRGPVIVWHDEESKEKPCPERP